MGKQHLSVFINDSAKEKIKEYAQKTGRNYSSTVEWLITKYADYDLEQVSKIKE